MTLWTARNPQDEEKASQLREAAEKVAELRSWLMKAGWDCYVDFESEGSSCKVVAKVRVRRQVSI